MLNVNERATAEFLGKLMEKLDILILQFFQSNLIQPPFCLEKLFVFW